MGHIERLEVHDFKSYKGAGVIGPFKKFTAVIGPNGAGKSNLMDAISFVVGVETKQLRGEMLKDLIYNADGRRDELKREGSVTMVYLPQEGEVENEAAGREIKFQRTISSNGTCKYRYQGQGVTREVYNAKLKDIGVLVKARNFLVFQGDVEAIAAKSPLQLTQFFEEISASSELAGAYKELKAKKDEAETDTIFTFRQKKGIAQERKQAKEQKKEADRFNEKLTELENLKSEQFLTQLWLLEKDIESVGKSITTVESELAEAKLKENTAEAFADEKKKECGGARKSLGLAEKKIRTLRSELASAEQSKIKATEAVVHFRKSVDIEQQTVEKTKQAVESTAKERKNLEDLINEVKAKEKEFATKLDSLSSQTVLSKDHLDQVETIMESAKGESIALRAKIDTLRRAYDANKERLDNLSRNIEQLKRKEDQIGQDAQMLVKREEKIVEAIQKAQLDVKKYDEDLVNQEKTLSKLKKDREQAEEDLREANNKLHHAKAIRAESQNERKAKQVLEDLKQLSNGGVKGRMIDLCTPINRRYDTAISVALGRFMDAIVVDSEKTGKDCIGYMRDKRLGVATFIPLDTIEPKRVLERHRQLGAKFKLAIDVLEFDPNYENAVQYVLGGVVICDTLDDARDLCFTRGERVKAVTLEGHTISTNGDMTGGAAGGEKGSQSRFEQKELDAARQHRNNIREKLADINTKISEMLGGSALTTRRGTSGTVGDIGGSMQESRVSKSNVETKLRYAKLDLEKTQTKLESYKEESEVVKAQIAKLRPEKDELLKRVSEEEKELNDLVKSIEDIQEKRLQEYGKKINIPNLKEVVDKSHSEKRKLKEMLATLSDQKNKLESQLRYVLSRKLDASLKIAEEKAQTLAKKLKEREREATEITESFNKKNQELDEAEENLKQHKRAIAEHETAYKEAEMALQEAILFRSQVMKKLSALENNAEKLRAKRHETLHKAELEQVYIPTKSNRKRGRASASGTSKRGKATKKRSTRSSVESSSNQSSEEEGSSENEEETSSTDHSSSDPSSLGFSNSDSAIVQDDKEILKQVDFSSIESRCSDAVSQHQREAVLKEYERDIRALSEELEKMQPNMKADERFADVTERLKNTDEKLAQARQQSREVEIAFEKVKQARYQKFMDMFEHVSTTIDKVYRELTKSDKHPMGGNAYLSLDNTEEPYLGGIKYNAMPPTKRFRDMEQLSGGEKTVAALALLFAIHSYHPAPFFVMDEVDAALDMVNVSKVSSFIRSKADEVQCVVISLKDSFFKKAEGLVGVFREKGMNCSRTVTLDLSQYAEE